MQKPKIFEKGWLPLQLLQKVINYPWHTEMANGIRNLRIACNSDNIGNLLLGELNLKLKNTVEASFKIVFTIRGFYTHESLSGHTSFRPI
jgi:hypothetical protein